MDQWLGYLQRLEYHASQPNARLPVVDVKFWINCVYRFLIQEVCDVYRNRETTLTSEHRHISRTVIGIARTVVDLVIDDCFCLPANVDFFVDRIYAQHVSPCVSEYFTSRDITETIVSMVKEYHSFAMNPPPLRNDKPIAFLFPKQDDLTRFLSRMPYPGTNKSIASYMLDLTATITTDGKALLKFDDITGFDESSIEHRRRLYARYHGIFDPFLWAEDAQYRLYLFMKFDGVSFLLPLCADREWRSLDWLRHIASLTVRVDVEHCSLSRYTMLNSFTMVSKDDDITAAATTGWLDFIWSMRLTRAPSGFWKALDCDCFENDVLRQILGKRDESVLVA